jgi:hypothetical protein
MNEAYYTDNPEFKEIALLAFPGYSGRKFKLDTFTGPMNLTSYWDGGSKESYVILNLKTRKSKVVPENGTPYTGKSFRISKLPEGFAVVEHSIFMGKDMGITIFVNPENMAKMLPAPDETPWAEKVVLSATRSLKSSYAGIKDYRFHEAFRDTGITKPEWDKAKESCIQKGLLNKVGAITDKGRNAIGNENLRTLKRPIESDPPNNSNVSPT